MEKSFWLVQYTSSFPILAKRFCFFEFDKKDKVVLPETSPLWSELINSKEGRVLVRYLRSNF
jgi:hypothetical protein